MTRLLKRVAWGLPILAVAGFVAFAPLGLQGAQKSKASPKAGSSKAAKSDAKSDDAKADEGESKEKEGTAPASTFKLPEQVYSTGYNGSYVDLIKFINTQIRQGWTDNEIRPSDPADDAEWVRRVHLDIVGHIPDLDTVQKFIADKDKAKRSKLIDKLLDEDAGYVRNFTTIWTNNLIGRRPPQNNTGIIRGTLQKFLRESFGKNRGWNEIVTDLLTAEGNNQQNGAANFLLSHMNDGAVPATAISSKLFLGLQVQCTQCHNHPFNEWKQNAFWEFNSFFKQDRATPIREYNEKTGRMDVVSAELRHQEFGGPIYFERRNGLMEVAYPKYMGSEVNPEASTNRRKELAALITTGERTQLADAMVNRMWGQFFGYGFTKPIDDMGPHNAPSNPVLLERLSREFVTAKYDVRQLIRWICNSEAYNLTSRVNTRNPKAKQDNPASGDVAIFSHMYLKSMSAEQLYDSLIIATGAHKSGSGSWEKAESTRQRWMQQFVQAFGTDENDESTSFDGTIPQALMMMNGELITNALSDAKGTLLYDVLNGKSKPVEKVKSLYQATLSRAPSAREIQTANKILQSASSPLEAYQDLYWALLNSNEFIMNH
ncbi:MAG: DUF1553 domain-containing protein [Planctomycetia bacterium]|nr:DUF1553 domain-containing protein [Planctomycetia bacterium]